MVGILFKGVLVVNVTPITLWSFSSTSKSAFDAKERKRRKGKELEWKGKMHLLKYL